MATATLVMAHLRAKINAKDRIQEGWVIVVGRVEAGGVERHAEEIRRRRECGKAVLR